MADLSQLPKLTRRFTIVVSVAVDDPTKEEYEKSMTTLCTNMFGELKSIVKNYDHGTGRLSIDIQQVIRDD